MYNGTNFIRNKEYFSKFPKKIYTIYLKNVKLALILLFIIFFFNFYIFRQFPLRNVNYFAKGVHVPNFFVTLTVTTKIFFRK